jgi:hypothetical protein
MGRKSTQEKLPSYEERLILFIDFLGFSEIVETTATNSKALHRLVRAMDRLGEISDSTILPLHKVTQFSDSIVVSYRITEQSAVFHLLNAIAFCVVDLAQMGYLVRGGVTVGKLYHTGKHVVGPAMIDAYRLEAKIAQVPRVVIDKKLLAIARKYRDEMHTEEDEAKYASNYMTLDRDGQYFFDYVSFRSVIEVTGGEADLYPAYLRSLGHLLAEGLVHPDLAVRAKYVWLHRRYLAEIEQVESLPEVHPFRVNEPEIFQDIVLLPKLTTKAAEVRAEALAAKLPVTALY